MNIARLACVPLIASALLVGGCTAEVEEQGEMPEVNVEGGDLPRVDVDPANVDVNVSSDTQTVVTPDVDVNTRPSGTSQ